MRRVRSPCCARTASGHAAAPPRSVMSERRFTAGPFRAFRQKVSTSQPWQETTALRDFNAAYDRYGSIAPDRHDRDGRPMSAPPPIAVKHWHRSETPLRADFVAEVCRERSEAA